MIDSVLSLKCFKFLSEEMVDQHQRLDRCTKRTNKSSYLDINNGHYRTNQAFIVKLGFLGVHSDEDHHQR